ISSDIESSETSNSAEPNCRQNISAGPSTVLAKSIPSAVTRPSMIGRVRGLSVTARLSFRLAMLPPPRPQSGAERVRREELVHRHDARRQALLRRVFRCGFERLAIGPETVRDDGLRRGGAVFRRHQAGLEMIMHVLDALALGDVVRL